ncbi:MAG TPA: NFACT RNA binding domain-containing protein [Longimicrobiales bacterium]
MSNAIRYDSLLVRYLADELAARLTGRPVEAISLDPARRRAAILLDDSTLTLDLHPTSGLIHLAAPAGALPEPVRTARRTTVAGVAAPPDERILLIDLAVPHAPAERPRRIVVELLANQWNLLALDGEGRIVAALWRRTAGARQLRPGARYAPPPAPARQGLEAPLDAAKWRALLGPVPPPQRPRALIDAVAYTSPLNAPALLGEAARTDAPDALDAAHTRYVALAVLPPAAPHLLEMGTRLQPYPLPLPGIPGLACASLLEAIARAGGAEGPAAPPMPRVPAALLERLRERIARLEARRRRLDAELAAAAPAAERLRRDADLLLSQLDRVRKGSDHAVLSDFSGGTVRVALDPARSPVENANRLYAEARKRERASERIPPLLQRVDEERARLEALRKRAESGEDVGGEVAAVIGDAPERTARRKAQPPALPYRTYHTTGGLEVRVGRSGRANDELTFHHSAPTDIWLHARAVAGAHVVLRWSDPDGNPPARDLTEAAVLAALHSRARSSGTVAVDWTRRKYVRKPRRSPPGRVAIERARTLFVEPDETVERRLRDRGG